MPSQHPPGQLNSEQPTMHNPLIIAQRIWDGGKPVAPACMYPPVENAIEQVAAKGQLQGTDLEVLGEIASRICYDSLGTGRPSVDFHKNILKVNHLSVYEHCVFTIAVDVPESELSSFLFDCMNRPSLYVRLEKLDRLPGQTGPTYVRLRITLNLRHILEWRTDSALKCIVRELGNAKAPAVVSPWSVAMGLSYKEVEPHGPHEQWITLLLTGSRGFSHELVRHGDWTAISQRSTRYVDENESPWVEHPLESMFVREADTVLRAPNGEAVEASVGMRAANVEREAKRTYALMVQKLEAWLIGRGTDKFTARKQARGAARGYLGNALLTEVVFSANVAQWQHMLRMRACQAADAEIREVFCKALPELQSSRYGSAFAGFSLAPAPDGIGQILVEAP